MSWLALLQQPGLACVTLYENIALTFWIIGGILDHLWSVKMVAVMIIARYTSYYTALMDPYAWYVLSLGMVH